MGAFADLYQSKELDKKKPIGFGSVQEEPKKETVNVTSADLIKAGVPPEFLGRIPVITNTNELTLENLVEILYKSKGGAIDEEVEFCKNLGVTIKFTSGYMQEIANSTRTDWQTQNQKIYEQQCLNHVIFALENSGIENT